MTAEDFVKTSLGFAYDRSVKRLNEIEGGKAPSLQDRMPGGIWANEAKQLIATADLLGCSIDYLLGREVPERDTMPARENVSNSDTWHTGTPPEPGTYIGLIRYIEDGPLDPDNCDWDGSKWFIRGEAFEEYGIELVYWAPYPKEQTSPLNESCITGMSPSGHCGAAAYCESDHTCCLQCDESCNSRCGFIDGEEGV